MEISIWRISFRLAVWGETWNDCRMEISIWRISFNSEKNNIRQMIIIIFHLAKNNIKNKYLPNEMKFAKWKFPFGKSFFAKLPKGTKWKAQNLESLFRFRPDRPSTDFVPSRRMMSHWRIACLHPFKRRHFNIFSSECYGNPRDASHIERAWSKI